MYMVLDDGMVLNGNEFAVLLAWVSSGRNIVGGRQYGERWEGMKKLLSVSVLVMVLWIVSRVGRRWCVLTLYLISDVMVYCMVCE